VPSLSSCDAYWDLLSAYADGLSSASESVAVELHVASCPACARDLQFMRETARMLAQTPEVAPPPGLQQAILAATVYRPGWRQRVRDTGRRFAPQPLRGLALAGSLAAILFVGYMGYTRQPRMPLPSSRQDQGSTTLKPATIASGKPAGTSPSKTAARIVAPPPPATNDARQDEIATELDDLASTNADSSRRVGPIPRNAGTPATRYTALQPLRRLATKPHTTLADVIAPSLQPERPAQPDDMQITTADMKTPMPMTLGRSDMDPKSPMDTGGKEGEAVSAAPSAKSRFALAIQTETSTSGALVSLAELRRQLRKQNETPQTIHPELHLRGRRDMLDVVKSSF
jgi:hypothetical protein